MEEAASKEKLIRNGLECKDQMEEARNVEEEGTKVEVEDDNEVGDYDGADADQATLTEPYLTASLKEEFEPSDSEESEESEKSNAEQKNEPVSSMIESLKYKDTGKAKLADEEKSEKHDSVIELALVEKIVSQGESSSRNPNNDEVMQRMDAKLYKAALQGPVAISDEYVENVNLLLHARTPTGNSILHIHVALPVKKNAVNVRFLNKILARSELFGLLYARNHRGETSLHLAANFGQLNAVKLFLAKDPSLLYIKNVEDDTALHMATRNMHTKVVNYLLTLGSSEYTTNSAGETPLYLAVQSGSKELVHSMLSSIHKPQHGSKLTGTILHAAVLWGNSDMVIEIENKYPELIQSQDSHGQTWVHYAAGMDNMILKVLLKHKSCTAAYIRDNEGRTPAHNIAAQHNYVDGLKSIMEYFPDSCEIVDKKGRNIVHYAAFLGQIETLDYFLMDSRFINLLNKTEDDGNTPLHLLASSLTDLPIASLYKMQLLIPKLRELQLKTYNQSKLTPGDIANAIKISDLELAYQDVVNDFIKVAPKGGMIKHWFSPLESHKCDIEAQKKDIASNLLRTTKTHMVVATISFAAGLSVPGGFNQNDKDDVNRGAAMLGNKTAFRVFMISDSIALASALIAILCYLWIAFGKGKGCSTQLFIGAFQVITISIFALMIAFMAGTYAILQQSTEVIAFFVLLIFSTFTYIYILFAMTVTKFSFARKNLMKNRFRKSPKKWKEEVLHGQINTLAEYFFKRLQNRS